MCKRTVATIKQFDYSSKEEFKRDIEKMKEKGYHLIDEGMFQNILRHRKIDNDTWKYTAFFVKSDY